MLPRGLEGAAPLRPVRRWLTAHFVTPLETVGTLRRFGSTEFDWEQDGERTCDGRRNNPNLSKFCTEATHGKPSAGTEDNFCDDGAGD